MGIDSATPSASAPLLRTLSPALRGLERSLRGWLDFPHKAKLSTIHRAALEGLSTDLHRQADALDVERPLLVIMLMGGTGVGKSTLLNALAGGNVAIASFTRPTTRDPVVYYHESIRPDRLDPALRSCRLVPHNRPALEQKIIVDTPDLDSTHLENREKLIQVLPVADIVLFVGSQEKYHDQIGWEIFLRQRRRKAFAFVMNKWDRCSRQTETGLRPDDDLLRDLKDEGFATPLLFRTCAQHWVDKANVSNQSQLPVALPANTEDLPPLASSSAVDSPTAELPDGEQFLDLIHWLESGLSRLEIEAIKARGVSQMLHHLEEALDSIRPLDLTEAGERVRKAWSKPLNDDARTTTDVLINTLEPFQREIEHHFALEGQHRFRGIMGSYLGLFTKMRYAGSTLRQRIPFVSHGSAERAPAAWDLAMFTRACSDVTANRQLDARGKALANRLLVEADGQGFPVDLLTDSVEAASRIDWRQRYAQILSESLHHVESQWTRPTGARRYVHGTLLFLADWVPIAAFLVSLVWLLIRYFDPWQVGLVKPSIWDILIPFMILLIVLIIMHLLIALLLPMKWSAIREEFRKELGKELVSEQEERYTPLVSELVAALLAERKQVDNLVNETREVTTWLEKHERSSEIAGLYGK